MFQEENRGFVISYCDRFSSAGVVGCDPVRLLEGRVGSKGNKSFWFYLMSEQNSLDVILVVIAGVSAVLKGLISLRLW